MSFSYTDDLGPEKTIEIYDPRSGLKAILVVDNTAAGPAVGGARMAPDVSAVECFRLARTMTFKNAAAGLPHGGAKSVIFADPVMPKDKKEGLMRSFARAIDEIEDYIVGPDMGTNEEAMAWVHDEIGRAVGLPCEIGGIPLDEIGATGWGLAAAAEVAQDFCRLKVSGARLAIQGFGAVGAHAARFLVQKGAVLVAAADSRGTVSDPQGLDADALLRLKREGKSVIDYPTGQKGSRDAVIGVECDIWIPAARPDVIDKTNVDKLSTRLVLQGANIPIEVGAERRLHERGILSVPDFIANSGGVICAAVEYRGGSQTEAFAMIHEKVTANTAEVLETAKRKDLLPRDAATAMARERVLRAMSYRRKA